MRRSNVEKASRNARSICSGVPVAAAGSGTPQCAVTGWPGQTGQTSFAALSHTVKTKSIFGAVGFANSSQLLLRKSTVGSFAVSSIFSALGFTRPAGWLPALYAIKFGFPFWLRMASARIERAELPVQRNKTLYRPCTIHYSATRQDGPTTLARDAGFVARTKALMNFPSMSGATLSTSSPAADRKSRACSTL